MSKDDEIFSGHIIIVSAIVGLLIGGAIHAYQIDATSRRVEALEQSYCEPEEEK